MEVNVSLNPHKAWIMHIDPLYDGRETRFQDIPQDLEPKDSEDVQRMEGKREGTPHPSQQVQTDITELETRIRGHVASY
jgi:hypothetical protein